MCSNAFMCSIQISRHKTFIFHDWLSAMSSIGTFLQHKSIRFLVIILIDHLWCTPRRTFSWHQSIRSLGYHSQKAPLSFFLASKHQMPWSFTMLYYGIMCIILLAGNSILAALHRYENISKAVPVHPIPLIMHKVRGFWQISHLCPHDFTQHKYWG